MQQERLRALGQMASGIAHDINNAISPVALYTESLLERESTLSERGREQLKNVQRAIHDVAATVARMREFYRQREPQMNLAPVSLNDLVQQVVELTRARWSDIPHQRGVVIDVKTDLAPNLPLVMGVESEIRDALTNLVFNAVDAMPEGGALRMRTRAGDLGGVRVEVSDTGAGMDEATRRRCLEPFFTTKGERGTGLGLAMVYGMVQRHSADIDIDSMVGRGTTVALSFAAAVSAAPTEPLEELPVPTGLRILVVDDDPLLLRSLREILEADEHVVAVAGGGRDGIDQFREAGSGDQAFDVVLTDLGMPFVDGRQVAGAVKAASPRTPVILLTGWGRRLIAEGDIPPHVNVVLSKPPKLRDLRDALARCCANL
jgi:CheY-like chemotaxis protein